MILKQRLSDKVTSHSRSRQQLLRVWYYVEGETGVGWCDGKAYGIYTSVSRAFDTLREAKAFQKVWHAARSGLFWSRIIKERESRVLISTHRPMTRKERAKADMIHKTVTPESRSNP